LSDYHNAKVQHFRDVPNIHFIFALVLNSAPNSVLIIRRILSSELRTNTNS